MIGKFFTTEQVANILQVHPFTILKYIKSGKLQGIKIGRVYRITESAVDAFLEERMTKPSKKTKEVSYKKQSSKIEQEKLYETNSNTKSDRLSGECIDLIPKDVETKTKLSNSDHYYII